MSYSIEELAPNLPVLKIDNKDIAISLVTLKHDIEIKSFYGSLSKALDAIKEDANHLLNILFILIKDKSEIKTLQDFAKLFHSAKESTVDLSKKASKCLQESIALSMPLIKNPKRFKELQEIKETSSDSEPCYAKYFDSVASRYGGYTLDKFLDLTLRQLHIILQTIGDSRYDELEVQAALQGRQLKPKMEFKDITPEQEQENEEQAMAALKKLQEDFKKRNNDGR